MENANILRCNSGIENCLNEIGVPTDNARVRTRALAGVLGIYSIQLDGENGKEYNPRAIFLNRVPKNKITGVHNKLYERACKEL